MRRLSLIFSILLLFLSSCSKMGSGDSSATGSGAKTAFERTSEPSAKNSQSKAIGLGPVPDRRITKDDACRLWQTVYEEIAAEGEAPPLVPLDAPRWRIESAFGIPGTHEGYCLLTLLSPKGIPANPEISARYIRVGVLTPVVGDKLNLPCRSTSEDPWGKATKISVEEGHGSKAPTAFLASAKKAAEKLEGSTFCSVPQSVDPQYTFGVIISEDQSWGIYVSTTGDVVAQEYFKALSVYGPLKACQVARTHRL